MQSLDWDLYPNFTAGELQCTCGCGRADMDADFMASLQNLRTMLNRPLAITSGYRCENHPIEQAKVQAGKAVGAHALGKAVDIRTVSGEAVHTLLVAAMPIFTGIGINRKANFIHLDTATAADGKSRPSVWGY